MPCQCDVSEVINLIISSNIRDEVNLGEVYWVERTFMVSDKFQEIRANQLAVMVVERHREAIRPGDPLPPESITTFFISDTRICSHRDPGLTIRSDRCVQSICVSIGISL